MFLDAFKNVFSIISHSSDLGQIVWLSMYVTFLATIIAAVMGVPLGFILHSTSFKGRKILIALFNTSLAIPTVVLGLFLYGLLSRRGILGHWNLLYTSRAMIIGQAALIFPLVVTFVYSALTAVDSQIKKTAQALGAGVWQTSLALAREARLGIILAIIAAFGRAISEVGISMMLGGNIAGYTRNMTTAIALEHNKGNFALALSIGIILLIITLGINITVSYLQMLRKK